MTNLFILIILFLSPHIIQVQEYGVYSMHFLRVEGNNENFENIQVLYMRKVTKQAAKKNILF